jgi:hypothetical protein
MSDPKIITIAKLASLLGFLSLVVCTYFLRSEVLALSHIKFSADEIRANNNLERLRESYPQRMKQHEAAMKHYELETKHYHEMLKLYNTDYNAYVKRLEDKFQLPPQPSTPTKPDSPEVAEQLFEINAQFRARKNRYFATASQLNWFACGAALLLVGGLFTLLMFDTNGQRWHYLVALLISFVFLIGPAFHSILTGVIGILEEPGIY